MNILEGFLPNPNHSNFLLIVKVLFGIALVAGSPALAMGLIDKFHKARKSDDWAEAEATITESKVIKKKLGGDTAYAPEVAYTFEVNGKKYQGSRIALAASDSRSQATASQLAQKYSEGTHHPVYYDPSNPQNCVLEKGAGWFHYLVLLVPVVFLLGGAYVAWANGQEFWYRMRRSPKKADLPEKGF